MQLTYRGIQYNSAPASLPTMAPHYTAIYRGVTYSVLPSHLVAVVAANLKYRGIAYAQNSVEAPETEYQPASRPALA